MDIAKLRLRIDSLDKKIIQLLNSRARVSMDIAKVKQKSGKSIYSPDREREVLRKIGKTSKGPLNAAALEAIYREIMSSSLAINAPLNIAYLGPQATFTHLAALKRFGSQVVYTPCDNISDVFLEVEKGNADYGVVPIENSIEGVINHTLDMFMDSDLKICAQVILDVAHNLLANCSQDQIKRVYSNPNVFGQCRIWLQNNLPQAELIEVSSTTRAAQIASSQKYSACIASTLAAKIYKLKIIAADIEDSANNITRFMVIGASDVNPTGCDRTSIMFSVRDRVGALHDMLLPFKKYGINLTKIESRPSKKKAWDYYFFVDLEGHRNNRKVKKALAELEEKCNFLKILGSYPVGA
ncbi:MAG: prephenate dehydratase [Candidatus Omnitrophica bacterium]|nr:prephenate dehydratase [Candidatus Omnitrophota bacterium]